MSKIFATILKDESGASGTGMGIPLLLVMGFAAIVLARGFYLSSNSIVLTVVVGLVFFVAEIGVLHFSGQLVQKLFLGKVFTWPHKLPKD